MWDYKIFSLVFGLVFLISVFREVNTKSPQFDSNLNCIENCGNVESLPKDCADAWNADSKTNGVFVLNVDGANLAPFGAYCARQVDADTTCIVIQRRQDGTVNFFKNWETYKTGFGNLTGEHWLGLDRIHALTSEGRHQLLIEIITTEDKNFTLKYSDFKVADENHGYELSIGEFSGTSDNLLRYDASMKFTTFDKDNDEFPSNCANREKGAWWYSACSLCNFNGEYTLFDKEEDSGFWCFIGLRTKSLRYSQISICPLK